MEETYSCGITLSRPTGNLYEILGLGNIASISSQRYIKEILPRLSDPTLTPDERYAVKALSDYWYRTLYHSTLDTKTIHDAGFFDDGYEGNLYELKSFRYAQSIIPRHKLLNNIDKSSSTKQAILFTTGGFAPIHNGHIAMMEDARQQLEAKGYDVVAGYLTPGHDSYVGKKYGGSAAISAADRVAMVELAVEDSDWLDVDPLASRYLPCEVNFTQVFNYLNSTLKKWVNLSVDVFYVYGSDNAGFGAVLPYNSVMVERTNLSSKMAREGSTDHLHPEVLKYLNSIGKPSDNDLPFLIRSEWDESLVHYKIHDIDKRLSKFQSVLKMGISQLLTQNGSPRKVHILNTREQRPAAQAVIGDRKTISLDPFYRGDYMVHSTRYFEQGGSQKKPRCRGPRMEVRDNFLEDLAKIKPGSYVLVEDDSVTGDTIRIVKSLLPKGVEISETVLLSDYGDYPGTEYFDVVDLRDFIFGAKYGGLTTIFKNNGILNHKSLAREIYALPHVNLRSRAKIPANAEMELSRIIWQANYRLFKNTGLTLREVGDEAKCLYTDLGWDDTVLIEEVCLSHVDMLLENV